MLITRTWWTTRNSQLTASARPCRSTTSPMLLLSSTFSETSAMAMEKYPPFISDNLDLPAGRSIDEDKQGRGYQRRVEQPNSHNCDHNRIH
ncbi:hypothetical protein F4779DRAFT_575985 [Xylariaceae sp. FL0662B]|nr:hypothetical protein F4779DRAFT_575985 [Xylariaceae sp. FL0662B]